MALLRDYEALRWWAILPLFAVLLLTNFLAYAAFALAWPVLPSGPDLSFVYYVVPGAWDTYQAYAACGYPEIGSFQTGLLFFNALGVVALDLAVIQGISRIIPIHKDMRFTSKKVMRRCFGSAFWSFIFMLGLFGADIAPSACDLMRESDIGRMFMHAPLAAIAALTASPALRNTF